jgi:hypothetical protein
MPAEVLYPALASLSLLSALLSCSILVGIPLFHIFVFTGIILWDGEPWARTGPRSWVGVGGGESLLVSNVS